MTPSEKQEEAKALMSERRWEEALPILLEDIIENLEDGWTCLYISSCYYELRDAEKAISWAERAEKLLPGELAPLGCQGDVALLTGDYSRGRELYLKALDLDPEDELAQKNWKRFLEIEKG